MLTVYNRIPNFAVTGVKPGILNSDDAFETITQDSFAGKWKIIYFFPKVATFVCPTEIIAYDKLNNDFKDRDAVLLGGSTDNEFTHLAWRNSHEGLAKTDHWAFGDTLRNGKGLAEQLGIIDENTGVCLRATFIVDPQNIIQHVSVNNLDVGRNADEALRILDGLQTGDLCPCNRKVGGETLK